MWIIETPDNVEQTEWSSLMKPVVDKLTDEDFISIAAYVSSRMP